MASAILSGHQTAQALDGCKISNESPIASPSLIVSPANHGESLEDPLSMFPASLDSELCWTPSSFPNGSTDYVVMLSREDVKAIDIAVAHFKALNLRDIAMVCPETFPLPTALVQKLRGLSHTLHNGRGFSVLRGLQPGDRTNEENIIAFCGLGSYVGRNRAANENGYALEHLRDATRDPKPKDKDHLELHPSKTMAPLKFHADRKFADILALFVNSKAGIGGQQYLSSFWTAYNRMMDTCPADLRVLAEDFPWPGVVNDKPHTAYTPVIFQKDGRVLCQLVHRIFEGTNILSDKQQRALSSLERAANENAIEVDTQVGDLQFVNNLAVLHARRGWVDRPHAMRHYFRLGLHDPELAWKKPEEYEDSLFHDHLKTELQDQIIPVVDFDPYGLTSLELMGHG